MKRFIPVLLTCFVLLFAYSCVEEDDTPLPPTISEYMGDDQDEFWIGSDVVKCTPQGKRFDSINYVVSVTSNRCNNELKNPRLTFDFASDTSFQFGSYQVTKTVLSNGFFVNIGVTDYNSNSYEGISGRVVVRKSSGSNDRFDIVFSNVLLESTLDSSRVNMTGSFTELK